MQKRARLLTSEQGGIRTLLYYGLMHLAGISDRIGMARLADLIRSWIPIARIERGVSALLQASFRFVVTDVGGAAVDIDNEHDYDVARRRYGEWIKAQTERAEKMYGAVSPSASDGKSGSAGKSGSEGKSGSLGESTDTDDTVRGGASDAVGTISAIYSYGAKQKDWVRA